MHTTTIAPSPFVEKYTPMVAQGAAFLDVQEPGWHTKIDKARLSFPSFADCVLGQIHGDYFRGLTRIGKSRDWGIGNGFSVSFDDACTEPAHWSILTDLWLAEIGKRETAEVTV